VKPILRPGDVRKTLPEKLEEAIVKDKNKGFQPACVIGTVGTTSSTAVDPLAPIGEICRRHDVWFHVDADEL
jgi:aromatic-L-amino-acid decarboxylase